MVNRLGSNREAVGSNGGDSLEPGEQSKDDYYRLRGHTVSVAGRVEWVVYQLAVAFAGSTQRDTSRQWDDIKAELTRRGLQFRLQPELARVAAYFDPRNHAAHATYVFFPKGAELGMVRLNRSQHDPAELMSLAVLDAEYATVDAALTAVMAVAQALDDDDPSVLAGSNLFVRAMLMDRT
jgi:hypothetical protein